MGDSDLQDIDSFMRVFGVGIVLSLIFPNLPNLSAISIERFYTLRSSWYTEHRIRCRTANTLPHIFQFFCVAFGEIGCRKEILEDSECYIEQLKQTLGFNILMLINKCFDDFFSIGQVFK